MRADSLLRRWVWLSVALLLSSGCATRPSRLGAAPRAYGQRTSEASWDTTGGAFEEEASSSLEPEASSRLNRRRGPKREQGSVARGSSPEPTTREEAVLCGGQAPPPGWPHLSSSQEVLAPFLACGSPAEFVAMQRGVDMPRLVAFLKDWDAVRLGALGPLNEEASEVLNHKRATFLVSSAENYGLPRAEVFALFIVHSAFDDELSQLLRLLGDDKQLGETLGQMGIVREELQRRGLQLAEYPDRAERVGDVLRGLGRAGRDALSSSQVGHGARYQDFTAKRGQLPAPYQAALDEVEQRLMEKHFSPASTALGSFDSLTFGVPLGFFHLAAGTGHGVSSLAQGKYEQAARELAPAALMVGLYAGGKGKNPSASQWGRQSNGYFRWKDADDNFLDADGMVVSPEHPRFQELTHIPYEGI